MKKKEAKNKKKKKIKIEKLSNKVKEIFWRKLKIQMSKNKIYEDN